MKKLALSAFALSVLFTACKKDDDKNDVTSRKDALVGTWKLTGVGADANSNGKVDPNEIAPTGSMQFNETYKFNNDGTGTYINSGQASADTTEIKWALMNNDNTINIIENWNTPETADTLNYELASFTNSKYVVKEDILSTVMFFEYTKQ